MRKSVIIRSPIEFSRILPMSYERADLLDTSWTTKTVLCQSPVTIEESLKGISTIKESELSFYIKKNEMKWIFDLAVDEIQSQMRENGIFFFGNTFY